MKVPFKTLGSRMLALAIAQMIILAVTAVVIFYFTRPDAPPHHDRAASIGPPLTLLCGFLVLAIGAILTARWIVRPIRTLTRTADAIGEGELSARSELTRQDELGVLGGRIDQMAEQIERMIANERELLANVAHELRTPLARIGVALDLANEGDGDRARASLGEIGVDVAELEVIVDDVLTALRYGVSRGASLPLRRSRVAPGSIATAAADRMRARHPERPLEVAITPDLPEIDVDPVLFRRVVDNLLENSHKYTPEKVSPILLAVRLANARIEFEVVDRGIGIATGDLPNIYNTFFRGERSRSRETGGVGLGLTLAKRIVEAHGGSIDVSSQKGGGTTARITIEPA